jgi:hypothetical protein
MNRVEVPCRSAAFSRLSSGIDVPPTPCAPDTADHDGHRVGTPQPFTLEAAHRLLADCLAGVGAQQAAHTVIDQTRKAFQETPVTTRVAQDETANDLPRWRGRGRRAELTTQLINDRQKLDTTREHVDQLADELLRLTETLDGWWVQVGQREPRIERTLKLINLCPQGLPKHLTTNGPMTHNPLAPAGSPTQPAGYSLER